MRSRTISISSFAALITLGAAAAAHGQEATPNAGPALSHMQVAVACAMTPEPLPRDAHPLTVVGSQDTTVRSLFGARDLLVLDAGTGRNVQLGQRYFIRRAEWFGPRGAAAPYTIRTGGWATIVAANESTAIAFVEYACGDIATGDYLEPFAAPEVPADAERTVATGSLDFSQPGRVLYGDRLRWTAGTGGFMVVDRGTQQGANVGARYAVYRDLQQSGVPLVAIGEVVVVSAAPSTAVVRVTAARDAVTAGDYIVPRR